MKFTSPYDGQARVAVLASRPQQLLNTWLSHPQAVKLGICSYSIYLVHQPFVKALDHVAMAHHWPTIPFGLVVIVPLILAVGYGFHLLFEKPFMSPPKRKSVVTLAPAPPAQSVPVPVAAE